MNAPAISHRGKSVPASPIRKLTPLADAAIKKGITIYHLNVGQPDLPSPREFHTMLRKYPQETIAYAPASGVPQLVRGWQKFYADKGFSFDSSNIIVTSGGAEAIIFALLALCDAGDEVIVFEPFYTSYAMFAAMLDIKLVPVTLSIANGFHINSQEEIEKKVTKRTKAIMLCNPNNPTGTVYRQKEILMVNAVAKKYNLFILSDETYQEIVFDHKSVPYMSQFKDIRNNVVIVDSLSKRLNVCGARLGCIASYNMDVMGAVLRFAQARLSAGIIEQTAIAPFFLRSKKYIEDIAKEYEKRRDVLVEGLSRIPGVFFTKPEGAFYAIAQLPLSNADNFAEFLLSKFSHKQETVMIAPASGFYATPGLGLNEIRIAYVLSAPRLKRAIELLHLALAAYKK